MTLSDSPEEVVEETRTPLRSRATANRIALVVLALLAAQFLVVGLYEAWNDSPTFDEGFYVAGGVTALTQHQLRLTPEHGVIPKVLGAIPALLAQPVVPTGTSFQRGDQNGYYYDFMTAQARAGKVQRVFFLARLVSLAEGLALAWALYALVSALFGRAAGVIAAAAWLTTPFSLAFSHIVGSDLPFALAVVLAGLALQRWVSRQTFGRLAVLGLACVALLLTRFTGLALVPVFALGVVVLAKDAPVMRRIGMGAAVGGMAWAGVWIVMRAISPVPHFRKVGDFIGSLPEAGFTRWARIVPWPTEYAEGIRKTGRLANVSADTFLFGRRGDGARWLYWPGAMLVKLPVSALILTAACLLWWVARTRLTRVQALFALALPLVVVLAVTVPYSRPSLRYLLAGIVLMFALGAAAFALALRWRIGRLALVGLAFVQLAMFWDATPHSLAWTAPPFRPGYRYIGDNNDWGQDFDRLARWSAGKGALVAYFGSTLSMPGTRPFFAADARNIRGWVAVSSSFLTYQGLVEGPATSWLRAYCPVGTIGGTILLYRFRDPPDTAPGPVTAANVCHGSYSHRAGGDARVGR